MPRRIQLSRAKGWRKPEGAVVVARPSRWGNPFSVDILGRDLAVEMFDDLLHGFFSPSKLDHLSAGDFGEVYAAKEAFVKRLGGHPIDMVADLRGKDLCCWCPLPLDGEEDVCHASVLLEIANSACPPH